MDIDPGTEELSSWIDEPGIKGIIEWIKFKKRIGYQSVRVIARRFLDRVVVIFDVTRRKERGLQE